MRKQSQHKATGFQDWIYEVRTGHVDSHRRRRYSGLDRPDDQRARVVRDHSKRKVYLMSAEIISFAERRDQDDRMRAEARWIAGANRWHVESADRGRRM